ncbi:MAG TPA: helix-hairpin-helix domain-containing protein [Labilithrix sp.]|nr:helix-hairpin-helix domain-containing protein [Labilithrix sp.]
MSDDVAMGFLSKLFNSRPPSAEDARPLSADVTSAEASAPPADADGERVTPVVVPAELPADARPTPTDVYDRPTVVHVEPLVAGERPTVVAPEATIAALGNVTTPVSTPKPAVPPRPATTSTRATSGAPRPPAPAPTRAKPLAKPPVPASTQGKEAPKPPVPASRAKSRTIAADDLDAGFAAIEGRGEGPALPGTLETDLADVRALFGQLAANHMRQVRDFVIELRWGPTPATWVAVCEPSMESLRRSAEKLEFTVLASGLRDLASAMQAVDVTTTTMIEGTARDRILAAHGALEKALPEAFALDSDRSQREAAILHALLSQIPDVHKVTIDKLYAAGLTTLETLLLATTEDLVATTGIPEILAERIVDRFHRYREEIASIAVSETRAHERAKIVALVDQLRRQNEEFDRAAAAWTKEALQEKKDVVVARTQTMLEIDLQLARLGEIALVRELERLPFARKLLRLDAFVTEADTAYARPVDKTPSGRR